MGKRIALQDRVDDDHMWWITDIAMRQTVEKSGYTYGKVTTAFHFHHTTKETKYASDPCKVATSVVFQEPKEIVISSNNWQRRLIENVKPMSSILIRIFRTSRRTPR